MATQREGESKSVDEGGTVKMEDPSLSSFDIAARSSSLGARNSKYVFVESNRDILAEIGYAEDKARLVEILRLVEWDPSFWSLNDEVVSWFNSDSATINEKINELKLSISEKEAQLVTARKKMRVKNRERGIFDPSLDVFPGLVDPPNPEEPFNDLHVLADAICLAMRELETVKIRGLENECKLASMDEKLRRLKIDAKTFEERSKHLDVNAQLMAVEMQNSMLNELLTLILQKIKKTTLDMENLNSTDSKVLLQIIKDTNDLNFRIINECYPHMETKPGLSQLLWLPHDLKHMSFDEYLKMVKPTREHSLDINIDWKQRKKDVKELGETRDQLMRLKRKVKMNDRRKASGEYVCGLPVQVTNSSDAAPCTVSGITYLHSQQITREDPCDFCLCLDGEVFCWWQQQCLNTTQQQQTPSSSQENSTTSAADSEEWVDESSHNVTETPAPQESTCRVMGVEYKIGEVLPRETGTCLQCQCSPGARVTCSPKDCTSPDQFHALEQQSLDMFDVDVF